MRRRLHDHHTPPHLSLVEVVLFFTHLVWGIFEIPYSIDGGLGSGPRPEAASITALSEVHFLRRRGSILHNGPSFGNTSQKRQCFPTLKVYHSCEIYGLSAKRIKHKLGLRVCGGLAADPTSWPTR